MKLYDKGRFNLSDKLSDYLPWLQGIDKKDITIREILCTNPDYLPESFFIPKLLIKRVIKDVCFLHGGMHCIHCAWGYYMGES